MKSNRLSITLGVGVGLAVALLWVLGETVPVAAVPAATTRYVNPDGTDSGDCSDPGSPCQTIQYAVGKAVAGDTIDVAAGTYNENVTTDRNLTLQGAGAAHTIVDGNSSVTHQRVLTVTAGSVVIVTDIAITNGKTPDGYPGGAGGGIYNAGTLSLDRCTVSGNTTGNGKTLFIGASDGGAGGGIYNAGTLTLDHCTVSGNTTGHGGKASGFPGGGGAGGSGGGICNSGTLTVIDSTVSGNTTGHGGAGSGDFESSGGPGGDGGGISNSGTLMIISSTISNNVTGDGGASNGLSWGGPGGDGGGVCSSGTLTVTSSTVSGNTTGNGGDVIGFPGRGGDGGGIFVDGGTLRLLNSAVTHNEATDGEGGGVHLDKSDNATLGGNIISSNTGYIGGGVVLSGSDGTTLDNNVVANNQASGHGVGLSISESSLRLRHNTITRNTSGDGSGIHITGGYFGNLSSVALTNTILAGHSVGISVTEGNTVTVNGVLWHDAPITVSRPSTATVIVQNQHVGDPAFAPDGYHLTAGSAAIDKGVYTDVPTDIDGDARPYGAASDLGADECVSALHVTKEASSNAVLAGALLTYTLHVTNTGSVGLHATVTDTLPTGIAAGRTSDGTAVLPGEQITWTPIITTPGGVWTERLIVTIASDHTGPLVNLIEVATEEGARGEDSVTVSVSRCIYVPLLLRGYQP